MNIIITAGGTTERIDPVRKISNMATGKLGSLIAEEFARQGGKSIEKIYYLCPEGALLPKSGCVEIIPAEGSESVQNSLSSLLTDRKIDAVVHSMAVSDYTVDRVTTAGLLAEFLADRLFPVRPGQFESPNALAQAIAGWIRENDRHLDNRKKLASDYEDLMLSMRRTPKLIHMIKALQPSAILVGFKLLNGVERQRLLEAGYGVLEKNSCDFVLANDLTEIGPDRHVGFLLSPDRSCVRLETKQEIAQAIVRNVLGAIERRETAL
jgi:phosphopantothenate---cysteine ligase (CTP)